MRRDLVRLIFTLIGWIVPLAWRLARVMLTLSAFSTTSLVVGIPTSVDRMADSWIEDATSRGMQLGYHPELRNGIKALAYLILALGFVATILLTVFIVWLLFFS